MPKQSLMQKYKSMSKKDFMQIPGIGTKLANILVEHQNKITCFSYIQRIQGIGTMRYRSILEMIQNRSISHGTIQKLKNKITGLKRKVEILEQNQRQNERDQEQRERNIARQFYSHGKAGHNFPFF